MKTKDRFLVASAVVAQAGWVSAGVLINDLGEVPVIVLPLTAALCVSVLMLAVRRVNHHTWVYGGPVMAGLSVLPALLFDNLPVRMTFFGSPAVALVVVAVLFSSGLNVYEEGRNGVEAARPGSKAQDRHARRVAAVVLALSALLLANTLRDLHWLTVWGSTWGDTGDLVGFSLFGSVLAATTSGLTLSTTLSERRRLVALGYPLLVMALMVAVFLRARQVDFYQVTEERAQRIAQAIESYYVRNDRYPEDLAQLTPRYALWLPGPVIVYNQDWCYDGGDKYYRLGYVTRSHWRNPPTRLRFSAPTGRIYQTGGEVPDLPAICEEEIAALECEYGDRVREGG